LIVKYFIFETHDTLYSDFLVKNKLSKSDIMTDKKREEDQIIKEKLAPRKFVKNPIKGTKYTLLISSAKGGVGKSTFAVNIAFALQTLGFKIGILDADVYGPSLPKLMNLSEKPKSEDGKYLVPLEKYNAQCMSMGFLVEETTPMIWRGPMVISAIKTMTEKVLWKDLDVIIIDMPPGTGDTQLTFAQQIKVDGAVIVSTPQDLALLDVKRGIEMFDKTGIKILGLVDNMSFFKGDDGKDYKIFGEGGVEKTAKEYKKEFLGKIPIHQDLRDANDKGEPLTRSNPNHEVSKVFQGIAEKIKLAFQ
jgi:ATP-binding protein involved in chromosome partitioning